MADNKTVNIESKNIDISHLRDPKSRVESRMTELYSIKSHRIALTRKYKQEYKLAEVNQKVGDYANYRMNTGFALVNSKLSDILSSTPQYDFLAMDDEAKKNKKPRELFWKWLWTTSKTDVAIYKIIMDALIYGTGWGIEEVVEEDRITRVPYKVGNKIKYKDEKVCDYDGCRLTYIPYENILINGTSIESATECIYFQEYNRDEFFQIYGNNEYFSNIRDDLIPKGKYYYIADDNLFVLNSSNTGNIENWRKVNVAKYFNKATDEYIVLANGIWINPSDESEKVDGVTKKKIQSIPYTHKQLPIVCFTDHFLAYDIWGMGEMDITKESRRLKDDVRSMMIEVVKAQAGLITIDPDADWDETTLQLGLRKAARVRKDEVGFFAPNINAQTIVALEGKLDDDIIVETGIDFKTQLLAPSETATRTAGKIDASKKRINLMLKYNAYTFFERLARLRMSNMEMYYSDFKGNIFIKGLDVDEEGTATELSSGYGTFSMKPEYLKGKFLIFPIIDSLMGDSTDKQKQKFMEFVQLVANMVDPDTGKPVVNPRQLIEAARGILDDVVDIDVLLQNTPTQKTPQQLMQEAGLMGDGGNPMVPETQPGFIPPEQRSGAPVMMPSSPSLPA